MIYSIIKSAFFQNLLAQLLCSLPYMILVLVAFKGHWRFKKSVTFLIVFAATVLQVLLSVVPLGILEDFSGIISSVVYIVFIFVAIKEYIGKLIFTVLVLTNLGDFNVSFALFIEKTISHGEGTYYNYLLCLALELVVIMPLIYILVFKSISSSTSNSSSDDLSDKEKRVRHPWRYLWLIPAVFYMFWINYYADEGAVDRLLDPMGMLYLILIDAGSILIYRTIIKTVDLYEKNLALLEENHAISIQRLSFESLNARLENMRRTRHDLRHHAAILKQIRKSGDLAALDELIATYTEQNYLDQPLIFCENETVNIVLAFYSETAYKNNISFSVKADIPEDIFVDRKDLAVVFGNILENASDACEEVDDDRYINLVASYKTTSQGKHCLSLSVKNSYVTETTRTESGVFRSTKHEGDGIGISSVQSITKKYDGACSFTPENGVFNVSLILYE